MKHGLILLTAALAIGLTGCGQATTPNSAGTANGPLSSNSKNNGQSYRFLSEQGSCDTYQRNFSNTFDMCLALQVPELNNNCAEEQREAHFSQHCGGMTWLPADQAASAIKNRNGKYVQCSLTERGLPTITAFSSSPNLMLIHSNARANVQHSLVNGKATLSIQLTNAAGNQVWSRVVKSWQDELPQPVSLSAPNQTSQPIVECTVIFAIDPDLQ